MPKIMITHSQQNVQQIRSCQQSLDYSFNKLLEKLSLRTWNINNGPIRLPLCTVGSVEEDDDDAGLEITVKLTERERESPHNVIKRKTQTDRHADGQTDTPSVSRQAGRQKNCTNQCQPLGLCIFTETVSYCQVTTRLVSILRHWEFPRRQDVYETSGQNISALASTFSCVSPIISQSHTRRSR